MVGDDFKKINDTVLYYQLDYNDLKQETKIEWKKDVDGVKLGDVTSKWYYTGRSHAGEGDVGDVDPCRMCEVVFGPRPAGWPSYLRRTDSAALWLWHSGHSENSENSVIVTGQGGDVFYN